MHRKGDEELRKKADDAYKKKDFSTAFELSRGLAEKGYPSAMFTCGLILEKGWLNGKVDLDGAAVYYKMLAIGFNDPEGYIGIVRVILALHDVKRRGLALEYCTAAGNGRLRHLAFLLKGRVYEELFDPPEGRVARAAYLKAFGYGSAWSLRLYARSLASSDKIFSSVLVHFAATVISPIFVLIKGVRATRQG